MSEAAEKPEKAPEQPAQEPVVRPRRRRSVRVLPWVLAGLLLLALIAVPCIPALVESQVNSILSGIAERGRLDLRVRRITLFHTDFALSAGDSAGVENVSLEYSPWALLVRRHVEKVSVRGVTLPLEFDGSTVKSQLLEMFSGRKQPEAPAPDPNAPPFRLNTLPVTVGNVELAGTAVLRLALRDVPEETVLLPFAAELAAKKPHWEAVRYHIAAGAPGCSLECGGLFAGATHRIAGDLRLALDTRALPRAVRAKLPEKVYAAPTLTASFDADLGPVKLHRLSGKMTLVVSAALPGVTIGGAPEISFSAEPEICQAQWTALQLAAAGREVRLDRGFFKWRPGGSAGEGELCVSSGKFAGKIPLKLSKKDQDWQLELSTAPLGADAVFPTGKAQLDYHADKTISVSGNWGRFGGSIPAAQLGFDGFRISGSGTTADLHAEVKLENVSAASPGGVWRAVLPEAGLSASWKDGRLAGCLRIAGGGAVIPAAQAQISDISLEMPFAYPCADPLKGELRLGKIAVRGEELGTLRAGIEFRPWELTLSGSGDLGGIVPELSAKGAWTGAGLCFSGALKIPKQDFTGDKLTAPWEDKVGDIKVSGQLELDSSFAWEGGQLSGNCALQLREGKVSSEERNLAVEGLTVRFALPYLPVLRSDGAQSIRCSSVRFGGIETGPVRMMLRMDAPDSWCLEQMTLDWCGGQIRSEYIRFNPKSQRILLSVHCDRLDPIAMLTQLGAGEGRGNGSARISGSMQVVYAKDGGIRVRDSFLYSTPGEEGHLEMTFSESVKAAQSAGPVFDMTQAALKDFNYSWAKVRMTTENDLLKLSMQLNGSPGQPLYFTYAAGGIVQTDVPHKFQGILLDLNISLPLNDVLELVKKF